MNQVTSIAKAPTIVRFSKSCVIISGNLPLVFDDAKTISLLISVELNVDVVRRYKGTSTVTKLNGMPRAMLSDLVSVVS